MATGTSDPIEALVDSAGLSRLLGLARRNRLTYPDFARLQGHLAALEQVQRDLAQAAVQLEAAGRLNATTARALGSQVSALRQAVETEWYNGNMDEGARDRILKATK